MPSYVLDIRTLMIVLMVNSIIFSITMVLIWQRRKTYPGFGLWTAGSIAFGLGFFLFIQRGMIPDILTVVLANVLMVAASLLYFAGTRRFHDRTGHKHFSVFLVVLSALLLSYFTFVHNDMVMRIIIVSLLLALVFGLGAMEMFRPVPSDLRPTSWFTGSLFAINSLIMFARALVTYFHPGLQNLFAPNVLQTITFLAAAILGIGWTLGFVLLNSERLELDLTSAQVELRRLATTDFLTGVANSRQFSENGGREIQRARRYSHPLAVLMLDIDHFKHVNDTYGHAVGDKALVAVAATCRRHLRDIDILGRLGGEEFAMLLPETDLIGGRTTAERLRTAIAETVIEVGNTHLHPSVSIGVTVLSPEDDQLEAALKRADDAMYEAKRNGRNRVMVA